MKAQQSSNGNRGISRLGLVLALTGFIFLGLSSPPRVEAQTSGPLSQYKDNVHMLYIIARANVAGGTLNVLQGAVTAIAVRSQRRETFWLIEKEHVDPQFFYRERNVPAGTPLTFAFFLDTFDVVAAIFGGSPGDAFEVFKTSDHYAVLREIRTRNLPEVTTTNDPQVNEAAVIITPQNAEFNKPATFAETSTQVTQVPTDSPLFFINFTSKEQGNTTHGAPVFVQREGAWRLAGLYVVHGRSTQPDQSAVAKLPSLDELTTKP